MHFKTALIYSNCQAPDKSLNKKSSQGGDQGGLQSVQTWGYQGVLQGDISYHMVSGFMKYESVKVNCGFSISLK